MDKVLNLLGLAQKASLLVSGEFACEQSIKDGSGVLCIVASDASDNTKKSFYNSCSFYNVEYREYSTKELLGHAIGKDFRASIVVCDEGFSQSILNKMV